MYVVWVYSFEAARAGEGGKEGEDIKSDLTNYHAALHDMLAHYGVIADGNRLVVASTDGSRVHVDRESPRTEVTITPIGGDWAGEEG
jgi:Holliday junction resolvase RusA-like endonuclease